MNLGPQLPPGEFSQGSILIVEDDRALRNILAVRLRAFGFNVLESDTGELGVQIAQTDSPDLIIMDVGLPGLDGVSATQALKADPSTAYIPVIMLTARSRPSDVVRGMEAGAQEYLYKPFDINELLTRVRTVHRLAKAHKALAMLNTELEAEVSRKTKRLQCLYEVMRDLNRAETKDEVYDFLIACLSKMTGAQRISLFVTATPGEDLVCARAIGFEPALVEQLRIKAKEGIAGQVFQSGKAVAAKAYGEPIGGKREYRSDSFLSAPLVSTSLATKEGVLGVLNVTDKADESEFSEEEIGCIRSVADAAAITLEDINRRQRLQQSVKVLLQTLGNLAEYRDEETTKHLERVSQLARILAVEARHRGPYSQMIDDDFLEFLAQAAPMHDIGKVGIPDEILTKPGKLTDEEFQIMKTHTDIGRRVLSQAVDPRSPNPLLQMCIEIAWCHHERFDGTGYPRRLAGNAIPLAARLVALVDAYDAITSKRRYKAAKTHQQAMAIIRSESGKHFDPTLVDAFLRCHEQFDEVRAQQEDQFDEPVEAMA